VALSEAAQAAGVYLAGAAQVVTSATGHPQSVAYLFGPDGTRLLRTPKIAPDLVDRYSDATADFTVPAAFDVAATPHGQVGFLVGEDVLFPHLVRALTLSGCELLLNPVRETSDDRFEMRQIVRRARPYENRIYLACAAPRAASIEGAKVTLPAASALNDWIGNTVRSQGDESFVVCTPDIDRLRRLRQAPGPNFPAILRTQLYAPGYATSGQNVAPSPTTRDAWQEEGQRRVAASAAQPAKDERLNYGVVLGQHVVRILRDANLAAETKMRNVEEAIELVQFRVERTKPGIVVFPEFFITGAQVNRTPEVWAQIGVRFPGREIDRLCKFAQDMGCYVAGGCFEADDDWPGRFFNTAFIIDDSGTVIHRYRKIQCADVLGTLPDTTPGSIYSRYVDKYGYDHLFPVVNTPLGCLGTIVCFDMNFPETTRALVRRGAEVILHPTSEPHGGGRSAWEMGRRTRAFENTAYVVSAAMGGEYLNHADTVPNLYSRGHAKIVNYDGNVQVVADGPGRVALEGRIDLRALRKARANPFSNLAAWDEPAVYGHVYAARQGLPNDLWADDAGDFPYRGMKPTMAVVQQYTEEGIFVAPDAA
jgi:predicted amidohydrolase